MRKSMLVIAVALLLTSRAVASRPPNVIILLTDDQGYNDIGCYGSPSIKTPRLDEMASHGVRFTDFYVVAAICTPSRAGLLTGCYPPRVSIGRIPPEPELGRKGAQGVLFSGSNYGLNPAEQTIASVLKAQNYATACIGKWHLGDKPEFWPTKFGFDSYFGIPYSNDMDPSVLMRGDKVIEKPVDQDTLVERYTAAAMTFIHEHKTSPFFLYLAYNSPHTPVHAAKRFQGTSERGLYGDAIETIDWSVGEILDALVSDGIATDTLVLFTSDNGPWLVRGEEGGSAYPLRSGKFSAYEGGYRVPFIAQWPGKIRPGRVCHEIAASMDFLPTVAKLSNAKLSDKKIDGKDMGPLLFEENAKSPHDAFFYFNGNRLTGVRSGKWKLKVDTTLLEDYGFKKLKQPDAEIPLGLYNLDWDLNEMKDVSKDHPDVMKRLESLLAAERAEIGDERQKIAGSECRPLGHVENEKSVWDQ